MLFAKKSAYLIDSENVGSTWEGLLKKEGKFDLFIFCTENSKSLNFSLLKELTNDNRYHIDIIDCRTGKNNLDFHLSSYLGYLIGKNRYSSYVIVSQDTGYDLVISYWKKEGYDVKRINTKPESSQRKPARRVVSGVKISNSQNERKQQSSTRKNQKKTTASKVSGRTELLNSLLSSYPKAEIEGVKNLLDGVPMEMRTDKNHIYNALVKKYKKEKGLAIYTLIKKDLKKYYSL
ncbi:MAG: hypothetical protein IJM15_00980 [Erysipelotrichaceae bacterium]|nr:hypothetical protein [Erysipelotrichaceae bacterium]